MESAQLTLASHILKSRTTVHERKLSPPPHSGQPLNSKPNQVIQHIINIIITNNILY